MSDKCAKCGKSKGFFSSMGSIECSEDGCTEWLCKHCKDSETFKECPECTYLYCSQHIGKGNHVCQSDPVEDDEQSEEEPNTEETEGSTNDDSNSEEESEESIEEPIDLEQAEEDEVLIFSKDKKWVAFDESKTDDWASTFQYMDKIISEGYAFYCSQGDYLIYRKGGA